MKTVSINVMNLCVPCANRCRYCLLSYDGKTSGVDYLRSEAYAKRFYDWLRDNRTEMSFLFGFGYSMEHPDLPDAIDFCRSIGSASGEFLQLDGMKMRSGEELENLLKQISTHGIKQINLTFYGTQEYHDRFAARSGDYSLLINTLARANKIGLAVSVGIALSHENSGQIEELILELEQYKTERIYCFVPHSEGRGRLLEEVRFSKNDFEKLPDNVKRYINTSVFKTEREWLAGELPVYEKRVLTVTLTRENIDFFEKLEFAETIEWLEKMDDEYYNAIPAFPELAELYGDLNGEKYYSARDLYLNYQRRHIEENGLEIYDVNDESHCFSRRF